MKGRLWQCDPTWKRLHSQRVEFDAWPKVGFVFRYKAPFATSGSTTMVQVANFGTPGEVRFETTNARFELEKLP